MFNIHTQEIIIGRNNPVISILNSETESFQSHLAMFLTLSC